jgi:hypothetical protein
LIIMFIQLRVPTQMTYSAESFFTTQPL